MWPTSCQVFAKMRSCSSCERRCGSRYQVDGNRRGRGEVGLERELGARHGCSFGSLPRAPCRSSRAAAGPVAADGALAEAPGTGRCARPSSRAVALAREETRIELLGQQRVLEALHGPLENRDDHLLVDVGAHLAALDPHAHERDRAVGIPVAQEAVDLLAQRAGRCRSCRAARRGRGSSSRAPGGRSARASSAGSRRSRARRPSAGASRYAEKEPTAFL